MAPLRPRKRFPKLALALFGVGLAIFIAVFLSLPRIVLWESAAPSPTTAPFPVTVDPATKTIAENAGVDALIENETASLPAAVASVGNLFNDVADAIIAAPWYEAIAGADAKVVTIVPGFRKEQVAQAFGTALGWDAKEQGVFLADTENQAPILTEGEFEPGTYVVAANATPTDVQDAIASRFQAQVLAHYSTSTEAVVPLNEALTVASMIEREANNEQDMRTVSGVIWNRLFLGMKLQIDSTVQYSEANAATTGSWWPQVKTSNLSLNSPYNTYVNVGLPPGPIASPSVAAVLAALNPVQTSCLYYFNDNSGALHCSDTYAEHVALLKKYFGQGK